MTRRTDTTPSSITHHSHATTDPPHHAARAIITHARDQSRGGVCQIHVRELEMALYADVAYPPLLLLFGSRTRLQYHGDRCVSGRAVGGGVCVRWGYTTRTSESLFIVICSLVQNHTLLGVEWPVEGLE